ncbi:MAG: NUDIX domain-containing protein [Deltaproteobacteria bacterium]|nr:NUDIX domain-containing protein [Deltaproteobacteria bacterium]
MAGRIAVVDGANRFVRWEDRRTIHEQQLVHRSIHILVFDGAHRLLVQRRHRTKQTYPRTWDISCAGHVEESDYTSGPDADLDTVYAAVAARELHEELGVTAPLALLGRFAPEPGVHYEHIHLFTCTSDGPYTLQADEVEELFPLPRAGVADFLAGPEPITHALRWFLAWLLTNDRWPT